MKVIESTWFSSMKGSMGMVCIETEEGERKFYMDKVSGINQTVDEAAIANLGAPVEPKHLIGFLQKNMKKE